MIGACSTPDVKYRRALPPVTAGNVSDRGCPLRHFPNKKRTNGKTYRKLMQ